MPRSSDESEGLAWHKGLPAGCSQRDDVAGNGIRVHTGAHARFMHIAQNMPAARPDRCAVAVFCAWFVCSVRPRQAIIRL
ncbi:hypothetical protein [Acetobacter fallax]|uniref:Uncharacterized protein n=1 Tax=Acetobacter fallax TaxID=1737473 RepID=A0ABX0KC72_9PROT|nr:hypothetical protein [Acetobacter fallax]NHO32763.1 hypothetical protein [Acetobacter fallax]NHO36326.1 hypothetical protein [Acetobacter fallax]